MGAGNSAHHGRKTISWADHTAERRDDDLAQEQVSLLEDLLLFFSGFSFPPVPCPISWEADRGVVLDFQKMISGHEEIIRAYAGNKTVASPYLKRLFLLREHLRAIDFSTSTPPRRPEPAKASAGRA